MRLHLTRLVVLLLLVVACTSEMATEPTSQSSSPEDGEPVATTSTAERPAASEAPADDSSASTPTSTTSAADEPAELAAALPVREGPRRETSGSVPHVQRDAVPVPGVDDELRRRAFLFPGVEERDSSVSTGARGLVVTDGGSIVRREILLGPGEFAHIHPDGSLHVWLPVERAIEVDETAWGELHPWVDRDGFWDGVTMIFTPENPEELEVTMQLLVDSYNFVMGAELTVADVT